MKLSAKQIYQKLMDQNILNSSGQIQFSLANVNVTIKTTDIVGNTLQSWLGAWLNANNIFYEEPESTQVFPDFYLDDTNKERSMLEVKAFNYEATPAFDIANYESYVESVSNKIFRLDAYYLVFGYLMDSSGNISIKKIWLKKIWELAGTSKKWPLKVQDKRGVIYNIRPNSEFKHDLPSCFKNDVDFLAAIYKTQKLYRGQENAKNWKNKIEKNYFLYYKKNINL